MLGKHPARKITVNADEPRTGDYAFGYLYDKAHPVYGEPETIRALKSELAGLRGHRVTVTFNGSHTDPDSPDEPKRMRIRRTFNYRQYSDLFGTGGAYSSAIHYMRDKYSSHQLVATSLVVEVADDDIDDETEE